MIVQSTSDDNAPPLLITIPDRVCENAGITLQWAGIGQFGVHAYKHAKINSVDCASEFAPTTANVHHIRTDSILFEPIMRKLVNESNGTFLMAQKLLPSSSARPETVKLSRQYRSILRAYIENLQDPDNGLSKEKSQQYVAIFYNIEFVWHLCEILYVDAVPGDVVLPYLLDWIKFHFPDTEREAGQILTGSLDPGAELRYPNYWNVVIGLVLQGSVEVARALLRLHSDANKNPFLQADSMLKALPSYAVYGGLSTAEFKTRWHTWQTNVTAKIESGVYSSYSQLLTIMKIVSADDKVVDEMKKQCEQWYQLMVALLLYREPTVKSFDLTYHAHMCIDHYGGEGRLKLIDRTILALFEGNVSEVIKNLHLTSDSGWAATHLTNLLYYCGRLNANDALMFSRMDEYLLIEYGSLLMSHKSLWQVGVTYLDHCPTQGQACLELLLPRLNLGSEAKTLKVLQVASERGLHHIVNGICKVVGMKCLQRKRIGQALCWALRSQDPGFATHIADSMLHSYSQEGCFHTLDLLDNLGSCMLISDRLTFLGKYCEYHQLYRNGALREAATLLTSLFASKLCPKYFWIHLLMDALPLLEASDIPLLSSEDTGELISCLDELATDADRPSANEKQAASTLEKVYVIRVALNKNLAKALINEVCHPHPPLTTD